MIYIVLNLIPIIAATIAGLAIGLGWLAVSDRLVPGLGTLGVAALAEFWLACILAGALILAPSEAGEWTMAIGSAFIIWIGFVLPTHIVTFKVIERSMVSALFVSSHWLAVMIAQACIMQAWGLTAP